MFCVIFFKNSIYASKFITFLLARCIFVILDAFVTQAMTRNKVTMSMAWAVNEKSGLKIKLENKNMTKGPSLQDPFLNSLRKEKIPVSIYLVNGIKLQGLIEAHDNYVLVLRNVGSQMIYKHAISTVMPASQVNLTNSFVSENNFVEIREEDFN